jgi:hypothetical protein
VTRVIRPTTGFKKALDRVKKGQPTRALAIGTTIQKLTEEPELPSPLDTYASIPPVSSAYARRVAGRNLWIWYRATDEVLSLVAITTDPPVPIE